MYSMRLILQYFFFLLPAAPTASPQDKVRVVQLQHPVTGVTQPRGQESVAYVRVSWPRMPTRSVGLR